MTRKEEFEQAKDQLSNDFSAGWGKIMELANSDYEEAMEYVALCYYRGEGVEMDEPLAYNWFQKIVRAYPNNGSIWYKIADCYFYGYGVTQSHNEAIKYYQKAWDNGVADAGAEIGWIYSFGNISEHNDMTAAKWFQRAADKGSSQGKYFMGFFYAEGYGGLPISEKMAIKYLREAASDNNYSAIHYLLCKKCYGDNDEFRRLRDKMFELAKMGDDRAQNALGFAYAIGEEYDSSFGLEKNPIESQKWFEMAAKNGNVDALYQLGKNLLDYDSGYILNAEKGEQYLLEAYDKGNTDAASELYWFYKRKENFSQALLWGERAVESGNVYFAYDIGNWYFEGEVTDVDYEKAAYYYRLCIENNEANSFQSKLALLPLAKCYILTNQPSDAKYKDAYVNLKLLLDVADEEDFFSNQKGEVEYWLAYIVDHGLGIQSNLEEAFRHYSKSAELGFDKSQEEIKHFKKTLFGWKKI